MTGARPYLLPRCHVRALTLSKLLKSQWRFILTLQSPNIWGFQNVCHVRAYTLSNFLQPISADMRFRIQESGIRGCRSWSLWNSKTNLKRFRIPDSRSSIPDSGTSCLRTWAVINWGCTEDIAQLLFASYLNGSLVFSYSEQSRGRDKKLGLTSETEYLCPSS